MFNCEEYTGGLGFFPISFQTICCCQNRLAATVVLPNGFQGMDLACILSCSPEYLGVTAVFCLGSLTSSIFWMRFEHV